MHGPNLLRMKGIVNIAETPDTPVVIHGVQHVLHPPAQLERWPDADRRTRIVFIVRDIEPASSRAVRRVSGHAEPTGRMPAAWPTIRWSPSAAPDR